MELSYIEQLVNETVDLITVTNQSLADARPRASRFLVVNSILASFLRELEEDLPKCETLEGAQYANAINLVAGKNITEKKAQVELVPDYTDAREQKQKLEALREWVKNHMKIFENAHVLYRQFLKD